MRQCTPRIGRYVVVTAATVIAVVVTASFVLEAHADKNNAEGTWLVNVRFPEETGVPPFTELLVFHKGGTLSETNTTLHANSAAVPLNFNGSDGYGAWRNRRGGHGRHDDDEGGNGRMVEFTLLKLVFDGTMNQHVGFLRVDGVALIAGDRIESVDSNTELILGPDPDDGDVIGFGSADFEGRRISL